MAEGMAEAPPTPCRPAPPWRPWAIVALAAIVLLGTAVWLELAHRAIFVHWVGRPPPDWSDPQVRAYLGAWTISPERWDRDQPAAMRAVADMRPTGEVTAAGAFGYAVSLFGHHTAERLRYGRLAVEACPADSPRLAAYFNSHARDLRKAGKADAAIPLGWQTLRRAATAKSREGIGAAMLFQLALGRPAAEVVELYRRLSVQYPQVAQTGAARSTYATALEKLGRRAEAIRLWQSIADTASPALREDARRALRRLQGGK
jgi:hypothetical protein